MTICKRSCIVLQCSAHVLRCSAHFCRNFADLLKFTKLSEVSCTEGFSGLARSHSVSHKIDQVFGELQHTFCRFLGPLGTPRLRFD